MSATTGLGWTNRELFLPDDYRVNPQRSLEAEAGDAYWSRGDLGATWQVPVYRLAARIVDERGLRTVVDIGCGHGRKLVDALQGRVDRLVGFDQPSGIDLAKRRFPEGEWLTGNLAEPSAWDDLAALDPDLVLSVDVIEHLDDPRGFLLALQRLAERTGSLALVSTPNRAKLGRRLRRGPPVNRLHVREWTAEEFRLLVESAGFDVIARWDLRPRLREPLLLEARLAVARLRTRGTLREGRRNMVFLLQAPGAGSDARSVLVG
jgi:SAM-dependent methyltransferase